ncbi:bifunctional dTDP-4-dehydrorhamnose 3,5-epimerase family protein/NAD(P)-dependent oxidoreductase [Brevibacterium litoralis]|uniref:bifunctional dTDP-4-dehydrorhamnose 3,5-epimerase family protein/NAD(P)-dependent oxidoreductase n=1 Tax=Brevibacterium litoralis TaxID=3138935 RepID=UPI0032EC3B91
MEFSKELKATPVEQIPGMMVLDLPVHGDNRGWFKENWQREKMTGLGLPDFGPVQNNISYNIEAGTTRGIHAEPWDKFISIATGEIFGAWVDLREGPTFGNVFTTRLDASKAIYVPRGVGNSYQALQDHTAYVYLVNDHWSAEAQSQYTFLNLADPTSAIDWPISLDEAELSEKDKKHPYLEDVTPFPAKKIAVLGANGQLGKALRAKLSDEEAVFFTRDEADLSDPASLADLPWDSFRAVVNAGAYTAVDQAETPEGRQQAWAVNATGTRALAEITAAHRLPLVHVSTDYVFDGTNDGEYSESDALCPVGVYGQSKAAGELGLVANPQHYLLRTSWVIGEGKNFVLTMKMLAEKGVDPSVVSDQVGRLTFTEDLAAAALHLLDSGADYGIYNVSNDGEPAAWSTIARRVFEATGADPASVSDVTTEEYFAGKDVAPRPLNSRFDLTKLKSTGFVPRDQFAALRAYLN